MKKRGQISVFIIIGLVIVILSIFFFRGYIFEDKLKSINVQSGPVEEFVEDCIKESVEEGIEYLEEQGGTLREALTFNGLHYYYFEGDKVMPDEEEIGFYLSEYVKNDIKNCLDGLVIKFEGLIIKGESEVDSVLLEEGISVTIDINADIIKDDVVSTVSEVNVVVKSDFVLLYGVAEEIVELQVEDPDNLCVKCWRDLTEIYDVEMNLNFVGRNIIFTLKKGESSLSFVNKY